MAKEKSKRQCNYKVSSKTLDLRHQSQMKEFTADKDQMHEHECELGKCMKRLKELESKPKRDLSDAELLEIIETQDTISDLEKRLDSVSKDKEEIDYFMNTGQVLFEYYSLLDNSNNVPLTAVKKSKPVSGANETQKKCVVDFFMGNKTSDDTTAKNVNISIHENNRAELLDKYLSHTDENYIDNAVNKSESKVCAFCETGELEFIMNESIYVCNVCHTVEKVITDNEKPSYKDPPKEISYFSYKRINHYTEWLNQIQGKETTEIPDEIFDNIMKELKKQRIVDFKTITRQKIKDILKKLKINKYYEHVPYILNRITGNPNPHLSPELEDKLKAMFKEIQVPFLKFSPLNRKNFLSYSYVIHKFIQLLKQDEFLKFFPLLKSREKLHQQEQIWKKICDDLGWQFIRSI